MLIRHNGYIRSPIGQISKGHIYSAGLQGYQKTHHATQHNWMKNSWPFYFMSTCWPAGQNDPEPQLACGPLLGYISGKIKRRQNSNRGPARMKNYTRKMSNALFYVTLLQRISSLINTAGSGLSFRPLMSSIVGVPQS